VPLPAGVLAQAWIAAGHIALVAGDLIVAFMAA
jgi:hypothetical protein